MSAQEKTVQIDSFDAKFLDINTLSKLIYERKSFVIENVSDVSETVKRVEHEIEKRKLRTYPKRNCQIIQYDNF
ncbi:hypothetical protein DS960_21580 [Escherichia coli]|uniref:hypothetical protein n=1 Tax=Escherichia coli TaxID=562 RepID=UPI000DEB628B|nr:hypothetical protein [Escherichia coli]RBW83399.1 hypothetical protein DS960_21580 [Escherichia coli]